MDKTFNTCFELGIVPLLLGWNWLYLDFALDKSYRWNSQFLSCTFYTPIHLFKYRWRLLQICLNVAFDWSGRYLIFFFKCETNFFFIHLAGRKPGSWLMHFTNSLWIVPYTKQCSNITGHKWYVEQFSLHYLQWKGVYTRAWLDNFLTYYTDISRNRRV